MAEEKNINGERSVDELIDSANVKELLKKYDVADVAETAGEQPPVEEAEDVPRKKRLFNFIKKQNKQPDEEIPDDLNGYINISKDGTDVPTEDIGELQIPPEASIDVQTAAHEEHPFDAFPSFLHIDDIDIPVHQELSAGVDRIFEELAAIGAGIAYEPETVQEEFNPVPENHANEDASEEAEPEEETLSEKPLEEAGPLPERETPEPIQEEMPESEEVIPQEEPQIEDNDTNDNEISDETSEEPQEPEEDSRPEEATEESALPENRLSDEISADLPETEENLILPVIESIEPAPEDKVTSIEEIFAESEVSCEEIRQLPETSPVDEPILEDLPKTETEPDAEPQPIRNAIFDSITQVLSAPVSNIPCEPAAVPTVSENLEPAAAELEAPVIRIIYQAPEGANLGFSAMPVNSAPQQNAATLNPAAENESEQKAAPYAVHTTDFLANMRIIYEAEDEVLNEPAEDGKSGQASEEEVSETVNIQKEQDLTDTASAIKYSLPKVEADPEINSAKEAMPPDLSPISGEETYSSSLTLADLFDDANNAAPEVKDKKSLKKMLVSVFPQKSDGAGEIVRKTVLIIAVITMIICSIILLNNYVVSPYLNNRQAEKAVDIKINSSLTKDWSTVKDKYSDIAFPTGMQLKYAELYALNRDFSGWLEIPGIGIDMPIVQGENNSDYLKKSFYNEKSKYGCCFVDTKNNIAELDKNTIIYGHNTKNGSGTMFVPLEKLRTVDGFKSAPVIEFDTLYTNYKWKIYAVFVTNGGKEGDNGYVFNYIFRNLSSDEIFKTYIKQIDQRKLYTTGVDILPTDKILTLSTCCYDFDDARLVVVARMVRSGEDADVNTANAKMNSNPRYPQAWYTAKGRSNPYKETDRWFPS